MEPKTGRSLAASGVLKNGDVLQCVRTSTAYSTFTEGGKYIFNGGKITDDNGYVWRLGCVDITTFVKDTSAEAPEQGSTGYPDDNPKTAIGLTKPSVSAIPPIALYHLGAAMSDGKQKYGLMNWREHRVTGSVYYDAMMRHMNAWWDGQETAEDSGHHHLAHAMACMAIILDAQSTGQLNDDRPLPGMLPEFIAAKTQKSGT